MRVADLGEFDLIARLTAGLPVMAGVVVGTGDDAALLEPGAGWLVATCDSQVAGVHFRLGAATPEEIGWKALAVNLSDIAAMGATPRFALVSLIVPPDLPLATLEGIYAGLRDLAGQHGVAIVGGNVATQPERLIIDITALGVVAAGGAVRRAGARPGDHVLVTGQLGAAAAGLWLQDHPERAGAVDEATRQWALRAQHAPLPRVAVGLLLAESGATAALDVSDGLLADLGHLCAASDVGADIAVERLPIAPATRAVAALAEIDPVDWALSGGEDYELVFTVPAERAAATARAIAASAMTPISDIGTILDARLLVVRERGMTRATSQAGWDHLRSARA